MKRKLEITLNIDSHDTAKCDHLVGSILDDVRDTLGNHAALGGSDFSRWPQFSFSLEEAQRPPELPPKRYLNLEKYYYDCALDFDLKDGAIPIPGGFRGREEFLKAVRQEIGEVLGIR